VGNEGGEGEGHAGDWRGKGRSGANDQAKSRKEVRGFKS
jgi:hypothetical protein